MNIVAVLLNFFLPGFGSFFVGRGGAGVAQLLIFLIGVFFVVTFFLLPFGVLLMTVAWLWGLFTAATAHNDPQKIVIVNNEK